MTLNANEVKKSGVSIFGKMLEKFDEIIINVRGKNRYVVLDIKRYEEFRKQELDLAYMQAMQDVQKGNYKTQSAKEHIDNITDGI